jgi:predicted RNase H-like HicB family nuclease
LREWISCFDEARRKLKKWDGPKAKENPVRYTVVLEQEEDGGYVSSVPALPGCVSQGDDRAEAISNIREAIELYIEDCRDAGDPVPTEAGKEFVDLINHSRPLVDRHAGDAYFASDEL